MVEINKILNELKNSLKSKFKDNFTGLILFGSYAIGKKKKNRDLDIMILFNKLPKNREKALYGDEEKGITPQNLYSKNDAKKYLDDINWYYNLVNAELNDFCEEKR